MRPIPMTVLLQHLAAPGFFDSRTKVLRDVRGEECGKAIEFSGEWWNKKPSSIVGGLN
jgi:hypothetical protein